ncbi:MAG: hypothetical protein R6X18_18935 [Chloroflexota bacterium]
MPNDFKDLLDQPGDEKSQTETSTRALLDSLLGGGSGGQGDLSDLIGGLLGGGTSAGMGEMLASLIDGGTGAGVGGDQFMPIIGPLSEKLGLSPQMSNMLAMAAIGLLTSSMAKNRSQGRSGHVELASLSDPDYIRSTGVVSRLSKQMGISEDEAIERLQQTLGIMADQGGVRPDAGQPEPTPEAKKRSSNKTSAGQKSPASKTGSDFMDLLDDSSR